MYHYDSFERILNSLGYHVIRQENNLPITSYDEAVKAIKNNSSFHVAIIDIDINCDKNGSDLMEYLLTSDIPAELLFKTSHTTKATAEKIKEIGTFVIIPKPDGNVHEQISLFQILTAIEPKNTMAKIRFENLAFNGRLVSLKTDIEKQLKADRYKVTPKRLKKDQILYLCSGTAEHFRVPKNYSLIVTVNLADGYLIPMSLENLINEYHLDERFVKVNQNTIINVCSFTERDETYTAKYMTIVGDTRLEVSSLYKAEFEHKLKVV
ncbi:MAG: hypothetical protein IPF62_00005 [Bacteroidetes bacterium]|nr:hypothetical protein [Bacteroidota bacterium]